MTQSAAKYVLTSTHIRLFDERMPRMYSNCTWRASRAAWAFDALVAGQTLAARHSGGTFRCTQLRGRISQRSLLALVAYRPRHKHT